MTTPLEAAYRAYNKEWDGPRELGTGDPVGAAILAFLAAAGEDGQCRDRLAEAFCEGGITAALTALRGMAAPSD